MEDEGSDNVSWKVLGVVGIIALGLVLGIVYIEYIQPESKINNGQVEQSTGEEGKASQNNSQEKEEMEETTSSKSTTDTSKIGSTESQDTKETTEERDKAEEEQVESKEEENSSEEPSNWFDPENYVKSSVDYTSSKDESYSHSGTYTSTEKESESSTKEQTDDKSLAYQLATINSGYVEKGDTIVTRFEYLLDNIASKTQNTRQEIADMSVKAVQILKNEYGVKVKLRKFMEEANIAIPPSDPKEKYEEISARLIVLMK